MLFSAAGSSADAWVKAARSHGVERTGDQMVAAKTLIIESDPAFRDGYDALNAIVVDGPDTPD